MEDLELEKIINDIILKFNAKSMKDMGKVMGNVNKIVAGRADSKKIAEIVKKNLSWVFYGPVVQLDRISDFGSEGWGFESSLGHIIN